MNAPFPSNSSHQASPSQGTGQGGRQTPSVPISVYRELATELKATQAMVDSLTQQNHQLSHQNQILRQEMLNFAESADRLRQAVEYSQPQMPTTATMPGQFMGGSQGMSADPAGFVMTPEESQFAEPVSSSEGFGESINTGVSNLTNHLSRLVTPRGKKETPNNAPDGPPKVKRKPPAPPQMLYTEERLEPSHSAQKGGSSADLSGLWLATTILLIVVSAFGAGFLIMKPLLNNSR